MICPSGGIGRAQRRSRVTGRRRGGHLRRRCRRRWRHRRTTARRRRHEWRPSTVASRSGAPPPPCRAAANIAMALLTRARRPGAVGPWTDEPGHARHQRRRAASVMSLTVVAGQGADLTTHDLPNVNADSYRNRLRPGVCSPSGRRSQPSGARSVAADLHDPAAAHRVMETLRTVLAATADQPFSQSVFGLEQAWDGRRAEAERE